MTDTREITHEDYADEAESASRGNAWPQAAALYRRAADTCPDAELAATYRTHAAACDQEIAVDAELAGIARRVLQIPTLAGRGADRLDFHEVGVHALREALRLAYQAGLTAGRP
jgi:hypothetical protein